MLSLTIAVIVLNLSLGVAILLQGRREWSAVLFFFITLVFSLLSYANFHSLSTDTAQALWWLRVEMLLAVCHTFLFFVFVHLFAKTHYPYSWRRTLLFLIPFGFMLLLSLSPYLFANIVNTETDVAPVPGPLLPLFAIWLFGTMALSMRYVINMFRKSTGIERLQWKFLLIGSFATYLSLVIFNFIFAGILHNTAFLKYTPLYSLPIVVATAYAIIKHNLFSIKVLATEAFVSIISVVFFAKITISSTTTDRIVDSIIFLATAFFGMLLIRSVKEEVRQREEIHVLAKKLTETNYELARANEQLKILDQRKSEFVSLVSHQLRTPITLLKGYASMLLEDAYGKLPKAAKTPVTEIANSSERLVEMVADFLDLSKIEQGQMSYAFLPVDIQHLLSELVREFTSVAKKKKLKLDIEFSGKQSFVAVADEGKVRQIISNLIDNAVKYTPSGSIHVSLSRDSTRRTITICIADTGIGLSSEDLDHVFGKFTRGKGGQVVNTGGSGLGLYVAKKMVEAQHGKIWVESAGIGKGSTFFIELPAEGNNG